MRLTPQDPSIQAHLELLDPAGNVVAETDGLAGGTAILQTVPVTTAGTYTIRAVCLAGTGAYQLKLYANTALDTEPWGGASDGTPATAQSIDATAVALQGSGQRLAVLGADNGADHYYSFTLAAGQYANVALTDPAGDNVHVALDDQAGAVLATGQTGTTNVTEYVEGFTAPAAGTYLVHVWGNELIDRVQPRRYLWCDFRSPPPAANPENLNASHQVLGYVHGGGANLSQGSAVYVRSENTEPWGTTTNDAAMDAVFGAGELGDPVLRDPESHGPLLGQVQLRLPRGRHR